MVMKLNIHTLSIINQILKLLVLLMVMMEIVVLPKKFSLLKKKIQMEMIQIKLQSMQKQSNK